MNNALFWDKAAAKYAKEPIGDMDGYNETRDRMREILQPHHRVLELGCGTGSTALELAGEVDAYQGTDVSSKMVEIAQGKMVKGTPQQLNFAVSDAADLSSGTHDVILALNLLHLLPDLEEHLALIYAALPAGGMFIAKTALLKDGPWFISLMIPLARAFGKAPFVRNLTQSMLLDMLDKAGFEVQEKLIQGGMVPRLFTVATKPV